MKPEQFPSEESSLAHALLTSLVRGVCHSPTLVLAISLLLAGISTYAFHSYLEYRTGRSDLISPTKDYQQRWQQYLAEFGDDDDIVVVVQGPERKTGLKSVPPQPRMRQALESLAAEVRRRPALFDRLFYKVDLQPLHDRALLYLPTEQIQQIQNNIKSMSLLLELGPISWQSLTLYSLLHEARDRASKISPGKPLQPADEQFFTQLLAVSHSAAAILADPSAYHNPWHSLLPPTPEQEAAPSAADQEQGASCSAYQAPQDLMSEPQFFFSGDGSLAFLLTRPIKEKGSFTAAKKGVDALRGIVEAIRPAFPELQFGLTGLPVLESDEMAAAQHDTRLASWLAIAGVTLLFLLVYRGIWYPLLTVATLLIGTAWAMGWLTLTVGHLNILSATFAVMLIGMGDYGVLWVMRYEQARRRGADVRTALLHTTKHVAIGNLTAATTLALAFFAAMLADFRGVAELGWIAGCGVLLCALACFTVLPALLMVFDRRTPCADRGWRMEDGERALSNGQHCLANGSPLSTLSLPFSSRLPVRCAEDSWLPALARRRRWIIAAGLALTAAMGVCVFRLTYDHNLLHLQARDLDSVKWELTLIEHTAGASWHALSYTASPEEALALKRRYEQLPEVSRVVEVASLVPCDQPNKLEMLRDIRHRLRALPPRGALIRHLRPDSRLLKIELACLLGQLQPLADACPQPLLADLRRGLQALHGQLSNMPIQEVAEERLQDFEQRLAGDLAEDLHRLRDVSTPIPISVSDLPMELRERYIGRSGKWLLRVFAKDCLWDFEPLEHFTRQITTVDPEATGKPFSTVEGLRAMRDGFQRAGLYALIVIVAVLLADFRSLPYTLFALTPLAMGIVLSLGIMALFGVPLNPANMIAFPLILGVGVDNGVHVLHDFLLRRAEGRSSISHPIGRGVLVKAVTTIIGFGTLMISSERGLASLGFILTLGVGCCMVTALVFLPALLSRLAPPRQAEARANVVESKRYARAA
jgi:hopanoid biosynthesis associated RND transporter like protein HpnN